MTRAAIADGLRFGGLGFLAGAVLGPVRELVLAPRLGGLPAAWIEAAAMAALLWLAARIGLGAAPDLAARITQAAVALSVVLAAEAALAALFQASGLAAARAPRGAAEQVPGLLLLAWLAALPFLRGRG